MKEYSSVEAHIEKESIALPSAHREKLPMFNDRATKMSEMAHRTVTPEYDALDSKKKMDPYNYRITKEVKRYTNKTRTASGHRVNPIMHPRSNQSQYERDSSKKSRGKE